MSRHPERREPGRSWRVIVTGLVVILAVVFDTYRSRIISGLRAR